MDNRHLLTDHGALIDALGGTKAVAELVDIKPPSVSDWRKKGIPLYRLAQMAPAIEAKLGIPRHITAPNWYGEPTTQADEVAA